MLTPSQLQARVYDIIEYVVVKRQRCEDTLVELKSDWPPLAKTARRVAGHANAAHGEQILWIIGIDEDAQRVVAPTSTNVANWYTQFQAEFESNVAPDLIIDLAVPYEGVQVIALLFDTRSARCPD